jgi:DNA-binding GntR family transcriptional regulator
MVNADGTPSEEWAVSHRAFHRALVGACGSARLLSLVDTLRESAELYRIWSGTLGGDRTRNPAAEHFQLRELALARDVEAASTALEKHIERAAQVLLAWAQDSQHAPQKTAAESLVRADDLG